MFGFTTISIDAKGRLAIPAKYREQLQSQNEKSIVVTRDPQYPALKIYPGSIWKHISMELQSLQGLDPIVRNLQWTILGNAVSYTHLRAHEDATLSRMPSSA